MDLKLLVNPEPPTAKPSSPAPPRKRKRQDPKPIWAVREGEQTSHETNGNGRPPPHAHAQKQSQPPPTTNSRHSQEIDRPPHILEQRPQPVESSAQMFDRPISHDTVYDEVSRTVCDFLWNHVVVNDYIRAALREPDAPMEVEIEAKWGQIQDRMTGQRIRGFNETECVVRGDALDTKFESTMSVEQHKKMNNYLNSQVMASKNPAAARPSVDYKHIKEVDTFYVLDQEGFYTLPALTRELLSQAKGRPRVRVTRDVKTDRIVRMLIKHRVANIEINSPKTEWDYRISINLEIVYNGPHANLEPATEKGGRVEERKKDRVSYSYLGAYQVDLTQVLGHGTKNHELELELTSGLLLEQADRILNGQDSSYESLVTGMINNLRVLSREITPQGAP